MRDTGVVHAANWVQRREIWPVDLNAGNEKSFYMK
jgi:hypothetical protein